jgi:hypothetical protein
MITILGKIAQKLKSAVMDLVPIIVVVGFFQVAILKVPFPNFTEVILGLLFVVVGLMLFIEGLEIGLFPVGENLAFALTKKGSLFWLLSFSFLLGFSTTIAEPALIAVAKEAAKMAVEGGLITVEEQSDYALGLRLTVALSVGFAILLGIIRILKGWPIYYLIIGGYILVILVTMIAPDEIIGIAYDAGGVTTSTITVPLVTALGVGLASVIQGRNPLTDGFGLIAFASLMPMIFVMIYGLIIF